MPDEPQRPRLRGNRPTRSAPYDLGDFPLDTIEAIAKRIVHRLAVGHADITGDDWGTIFAKAISGEHRGSPLGLADVTWENCGWTVKTVSHTSPYTATGLRLISGRNSPIFSAGIENVHADLAATGAAVLRIYNARIDESLQEHGELRMVVLVRNMSTLKFVIFEDDIVRFQPADYRWTANARNNFIGTHIATGRHAFTWQPHGSQFTIHKDVPTCATKFQLLRRPMMIEEQHIINLTRFDNTWVKVEPRS